MRTYRWFCKLAILIHMWNLIGAVFILPCFCAIPALADDLVNQQTQADLAMQKYGVTGKGTLVVILDRGIDWTHPDFIKPDGTTRVKWLLDMSGQQGCGSNGTGTPAPVEYSESQINAALSGGPSINSRDAVGHGTVTAGLAAGNGRAFAPGKYAGLAPQADLIIVKLTSEGAPAHDTQPAEAAFQGCIQEALSWVDQKATALGEPFVALINSGTQWGPIDGTSVVSRQIDTVFGSNRPGRVYVGAAGDEGSLPNHSGGSYDNTTRTVVRLSKASAATAYMQMWYTGALPNQLTITLDDGTTVGPVGPNSSLTQNGISIFQYVPGQEFYPWTSSSGDRAVSIQIVGHSGGGSVVIRGLQAGTGRFDLYGDVAGPNLTPIDSFQDHLVAGRMSDYASTHSAIVSGDSVLRTSWTDVNGITQSITNEGQVGDLWLKSSGGPTRDGRLPGIDTVAPGQNSFAASAQNSYWHTLSFNLIQDGGGWYVRAGGTSGSAPIVVGAVSLMLQLNPQLTAGQIKQILADTSVSDSFTGQTPNANWGSGKLDVLKALDAVAAISGPAVTFSAPSVSFPSQLVGTVSGAQVVTLTNSGNATLNITNLSLSGMNSGDFAQTSNCGSALAAGANCGVTVTFKPTAAGTLNASLTINDNAAGSPQTVSLSGTGTDFSIGAASGGSTSATVTAGQSATYNLQVNALSGFIGSVSVSCTGAPTQASCTPSISSVSVSSTSSVPFSITVTTMARGSLPSRPNNRPAPTTWIFSIAFVVLILTVVFGLNRATTGSRRRYAWAYAVLLLACLASIAAGCGGGGGGGGGGSTGGTPAGTYALTVAGSDQGVQHTVTLSLIVN